MHVSHITRAQHGNTTAMSALVAALHPRLIRLATRYARACQVEPDDLVQEAWIGVLEALPTVNITIGNPEEFLLRYARWRVLDAVRRSYQSPSVCALDEEELEQAQATRSGDSPNDTLCIQAFLQRLNTTQRRIVCCLLAGLTWRETGGMLGCTSANIAYHMRQIRTHFQQWQAL